MAPGTTGGRMPWSFPRRRRDRQPVAAHSGKGREMAFHSKRKRIAYAERMPPKGSGSLCLARSNEECGSFACREGRECHSLNHGMGSSPERDGSGGQRNLGGTPFRLRNVVLAEQPGNRSASRIARHAGDFYIASAASVWSHCRIEWPGPKTQFSSIGYPAAL